MKTKKIFTPMIAVGLAMSLSVGAELNIDPHNTQIENFHIEQFSDGATAIDQYFYKPQGGTTVLLKSLTFSFADRPTPNQLTLQNDTQNNGTIALGGANTVNFEDYAGLWIDSFSIDFSRSDISQAKQIHLSFGNGNISSFSAYTGKSSFDVKNGQNQDDIMTVDFSGEVNSDFLIDSKSSNTFTFSKKYDWQTINVTGDITISADHQNNSKNTFNFNNVTYTGTFTNAISTDTVINLDGSNTQFIGDINTTGGNTTVNFLASEISFQGNITANGGNNTLAFSSGSFDLSALSSSGYKTSTTIQALNNSTNTININGNVRIDNGFYLKGSGNSNGDNIINIADGGYLNTYFYLDSGLTKINFLGSSGGISSNLYSDSQTNWQNAGSSIITFAKNGTFHIPGASVPYGTTMTHTFIIDKTIVLDDNFHGGYNGMNGPGGWSGVTFEIEDAGELKFEKDNALATLYTYEYSTTHIAFNGTSGSFSGNLNPSSSEIKITFMQDGVFGFNGTIYGFGTYSQNQQIQDGVNDFIIDHNITFDSQLVADGYESDKGNVFLISDQKTLAFSNSTNTAYLKTIGAITQLIFKGSSGGFGGNLIAEGGNNEFVFENAGTFGFSNATLTANEDSQNLFTIDKNITFNTDLSLNGNAAQSGGNIFNISSGKTLSFKNGSNLTTLTTSGGITQLNLNGSGGCFEGNVATTGGNTQINLSGSNGSFQGNISTSGGITQLNLNGDTISLNGNIQTDGGQTLLSISQNTTAFNINTTFTANSSGINKINFSNTKPLTITSENDLIFKGNATYESGGGGNILKADRSINLVVQNSIGETKNIATNSGVTRFQINGMNFSGNIITNGGVTLLEGSTYIDGKVATNGGYMVGMTGNWYTADLWETTGDGKNIFYGSGLTTQSGQKEAILKGEGNILYADSNIEGIWIQDYTDGPPSNFIKTISGRTRIVFDGIKAYFNGGIISNGGNNEIFFRNGGNFVFASPDATDTLRYSWITDDQSSIIFQITENTQIDLEQWTGSTTIENSVYTSNSNGGLIFNISDGKKFEFAKNTRYFAIDGGGKLLINFLGSSGGFSTKTLRTRHGISEINFSQSGTFSLGEVFLSENDSYNRFLIDSNNITISTSLTTSSSGNGSNNFIIENGGSLSFFDGKKPTSLIANGDTSIEFDDYGSLSGILQTRGINTIYFKNTGNTSPYAILDVDFQANGGKNIITITSNGTILKSNNGLQFSSTNYGSNIITIQGDNSSLSLSNVSDNQIQAINSCGTSEIHFVGSSQSFNGNINSTSGEMKIILGGQSKSNTEIVGKATINGNITANGGNNTFDFLYNDSTLSFGTGSQIIANSTSTNTFAIDKNITFLTDLFLSGNATGGWREYF